MHGAATTAKAAPSSAFDPRRRAPATRSGAISRSDHGSRADEDEAEHDEHEARELGPLLGVDERAERRRAGPEQDEDHGEAEDERDAPDDDAPRDPALPEPAGLDPRDRRQVAGDEREHAREGDGDEPGEIRDGYRE